MTAFWQHFHSTIKAPLDLDTVIEDEENHLELESEAWAAEHGDLLVEQALTNFPEEKLLTDREKQLTDAAELITHNSIKEKTQIGHLRIIGAFIKFMLEQDPKWTTKGGQGKKFPTAVSIRAALTYFYKSLRPDESVSEW
ncbi:hypothetical protein M422DRAFT_254302 [Sphaerobolus stellatus SS14]|uniref:Uncharacterized protein n=1 Tax=Sphaerobolus stellatus (strain SS14) TaxID=990650 RepID=A0A0C9VW39_SPHS4|nr:hypothetical protein M422DRAFT_254302 [Sphaerobolus stellatus SS14]